MQNSTKMKVKKKKNTHEILLSETKILSIKWTPFLPCPHTHLLVNILGGWIEIAYKDGFSLYIFF